MLFLMVLNLISNKPSEITIKNSLRAGTANCKHFRKNFCKRTISKLANKIKETENELIQLLEKETFEEIKETINTNQNIRDRTLRKRKQKKFHQLKFKPRQPQKYDLVEKEDTPTETFNSKSANEKSYASAVRRGKSKTDPQSKRSNKDLK